MGRVALAIGGVALIGAGIAVGLGWWSPGGAGTTTEVDHQVSQRIHTVRIDDLSSGDVTIQTGPVTAATVHEKFHHGGTTPGDAYRVDGDQLVLSACGHDCTVDFDVTVPSGTAVTGNRHSGTVRIRDTGPVDVSGTSGDVDVSLTTPEDVRVQVTSGDVRVVVPVDHYRVEGESGSGDRDIQIASDPAASHVLDLSTRSGDVIAHTA